MPITDTTLELQEAEDSLRVLLRAMTGKYTPDLDHSYTPKPEDIQRCMEMGTIPQLQARIKALKGRVKVRAIR